jgi:hypothetical protein
VASGMFTATLTSLGAFPPPPYSRPSSTAGLFTTLFRGYAALITTSQHAQGPFKWGRYQPAFITERSTLLGPAHHLHSLAQPV